MIKRHISFHITSVLYDHLKTVCEKRNTQMSKWLRRAILEKMIKDNDIRTLRKDK